MKKDSARLLKSYRKYSAILLAAFIASGYVLAILGLVCYLRYLSIVFALPLSLLFVQHMQKSEVEFGQISAGDKEVRDILDRHLYQNMAYRYGDREKSFGSDGYGAFHGLNLVEVLSSPLVIILCLCIAFITFIDPIYLDVVIGNPKQLLRLFLISAFQLLLFSAAFDGVFLFIKVRGDKQ